jgi:hypothetical protein
MINHWNIESATPRDPGTLSAYHLCHGESINVVQIREWVWASNGFDSALYQIGLDPATQGYRGKAWITDDGQIEEIEQYVYFVNEKLIRPLDTLCLRYPKDWHKFRADVKEALLRSKSPL